MELDTYLQANGANNNEHYGHEDGCSSMDDEEFKESDDKDMREDTLSDEHADNNWESNKYQEFLQLIT